MDINIALLPGDGIGPEIIAEATGYADTDNPDILAARENYKQSLKKYEESTKKDAEFVRQAASATPRRW